MINLLFDNSEIKNVFFCSYRIKFEYYLSLFNKNKYD